MPSGSSRFARDKHDFSKLSAIFSNLERDTDHSSSIRDCRRLGKYVKGVSSSRPLLVTLNSTADVRSILLSHNNSSDTSISIKPDLPSEERKANAILLKERWNLINSGIDRKCIKIRGLNLLVNGKLYGKVSDSVFVQVPCTSQSPSDPLPSNSPPTTVLSPSTPPVTVNHSPSLSTASATAASSANCPPSNTK